MAEPSILAGPVCGREIDVSGDEAHPEITCVSCGTSFDETMTFVKPADGETVTYADCRNGPQEGPSNWLGGGDFE